MKKLPSRQDGNGAARPLYIASLSYGKDSCAMLEVIHRNSLPLDMILHLDVMATETVPGDPPEVVAFKAEADELIRARYGIGVTHIRAPFTYEEYFYRRRIRGKHIGEIVGFPRVGGGWCEDRLKSRPMDRFKNSLGKHIDYIGIAADEPKRYHNLTENRRSPLVTYGITEQRALEICAEIGLLSPVYTTSVRSGCWFCNRQPLEQLRLLRRNHPELWAFLLQWEKDSRLPFKPGKRSACVLEERFEREEKARETG